MGLKQDILELLSHPDEASASADTLRDALGVSGGAVRKFKRELFELEKAGRIVRVKGDRYCLPQDADLRTGRLRFRAAGSALLDIDRTDGLKVEDPIYIPAEDTGVALHGDRVLVRITAESQLQRRPSKFAGEVRGKVIRLIERRRDSFTGTLCRARTTWYMVPDDPRVNTDFLLPDPADSGIFPVPREGDKIIVRMHEWTERHLNPEAEIIRVLGKTHSPGAEYQAILHTYDLNPEFPDAVMDIVERIPPTVSKRELKNRLDCRKLFTFTIDPDDAKDFDDALSIEELDGGKVRIGIHIADVTSYVRAGSAMDKDAQARGTSTYLVGTVIPMLPHALSNGVCSLVEGEDRLTKSVFVTFSASGAPEATELANTVIHSDKRLTYKQAYALLFQDDLAEVRKTPLPPSHQTGNIGRALSDLSNRELKRLQEGVRTLWRIASKLRAERMNGGSLDFDMPEMKILVDEEGYSERIEKVLNDESHQLIEEFMLMANETVARTLHKAGTPYISRVHDKPDAEKLNELREQMALNGIHTGDLTQRREVTKMLAALKDHPQSHPLKIQFLRSLKQACYRAEADGHYGLNKQYYAHFTSPIRRYADLVVHRIVDNYLIKTKSPYALKKAPYSLAKKDLTSIAAHVSIREQNSTEAERDSVKIKLLEYFERELKSTRKQPHAAIVTDVKNHGFFIELVDSMAFGFVPISSLRDDFYQLSRDGMAFVGRRTRRKVGIGQKIDVVIQRVDRFNRQMDFNITNFGPTVAGPQSGASADKKRRRSGGKSKGKEPQRSGAKPAKGGKQKKHRPANEQKKPDSSPNRRKKGRRKR